MNYTSLRVLSSNAYFSARALRHPGSILRSRVNLDVENLALRHQIGVLQRSVKKCPKLISMDRLFGFLYPASGRLALDVGAR